MEILDNHEQVVSRATADTYRRIVYSLTRSEFDLGSSEWAEELSGADLALSIGRSEIGLKTFKQYLAAARWVLLDIDNSAALIEFDKTAASLVRPARSKSDVIKFVPTEVSGALVKLAHSRTAKYSLQLALLLEATLATGLRPKEWKDASLISDDDGTRLRVMNGKYVAADTVNSRSAIKVARRGNGPFRELVFIGDQDAQSSLFDVLSQLLIEEQNSPWTVAQKGLRRELDICVGLLVSDRVIPSLFRRLTIYSFRHQAAADAKATLGTDEGHAAAALGHATSRTAIESYGRRGLGRSGMKVRPSAESIAMVDRTDIPRPPMSPTPSPKPPSGGSGPNSGP